MTPNSSIKFHLDPSYPMDFPQTLDLKVEDPISFQSYEEAYLASQEAGLPFYAVVVVESQGKVVELQREVNKTYYHIFDMIHYATNPLATNPVNRQTVTKTYLFALKCFEPDLKDIFKPIDLSKAPNIKLTPYAPVPNEVLNTMLRDAVNPSLAANENQLLMRRFQYLLAEQIKSDTLFPELTPEEKITEKLLWLWCSAKGSHRGTVNLFKECMADRSLISSAPYFKDLLLKTSKTSDPSLSRQEKEAILEAKTLVKKHGLSNSAG